MFIWQIFFPTEQNIFIPSKYSFYRAKHIEQIFFYIEHLNFTAYLISETLLSYRFECS